MGRHDAEGRDTRAHVAAGRGGESRSLQTESLAPSLEHSARGARGARRDRRRAGDECHSGCGPRRTPDPHGRGRDHLRRKLSGPGARPHPRLADRSRRHRAGRRRSHGGVRRLVPRRGLCGGRRRHHRVAARHDDCRRELASLGLLCPCQRMGDRAHQRAVLASLRHRRDLRHLLRLPGERLHLPRAGPARAGADARAWDAGRCLICWRWRWPRMSARRRRSPATRRTS